MWVYQKPESSEPLEPLSAPSVPDSAPLKTNVTLPEPNEPLPADAPSQAFPAVPEPMETPRKRSLRADHSCILLAGSYLFGTFLAGVLSALCSAGELETLNYYLSCWRTSFAAETAAQAMGLFRTELLTASGALTVLLLLGLSAIGSLPIFCFLILYGAGAGMLSFQLLTNLNWKALLVYSAASGLPTALAAGCLCLFGALALQVSGKIQRCSFGTSLYSAGAWSLVGQFVRTLFLLLPICGAATGMLYLCGQMKGF